MRKTNLRTVEDLISVNAVDLTEREIAKDERCLVKCQVCNDDTSEQFWQVLRSSLRDHGFAWRCNRCYSKWCKEERPRRVVEPKSRTQEELEKLGLVDFTPRPILQSDRVVVFCTTHPTDPKPTKDVIYNNLVSSYRRCGVAWRCPDCVKSKLSRLATEKIGEKNPFYGKKHSKQTKDHLSVTSQEWFKTDKGKEHAARFSEMVKDRPNTMTVPEYRQAQWEATHTAEFIAKATEHAKELGKREDLCTLKSLHMVNWNKENPEKAKMARERGVSNAASPESREKAKATILSQGGYEAIQKKVRDTYFRRTGYTHPAQNPHIRRAALRKAKEKGGGYAAAKMLKSRGYEIDTEVIFEGFSKLWDVVVYDQGRPVLAIDVDGRHFHGTDDVETVRNCANYYLDPARYLQLPLDVPFIFLDSNKLRSIFHIVGEFLSHPYEYWIQKTFDACYGLPFPYYRASDSVLKNSWESLKTFTPSGCKQKHVAGSRVMTYFHPSVYHARVHGCSSPIEAWQDPDLLLKCVTNRSIYCDFWDVSSYNVARGFEQSKIAPRVSMFAPSFAKTLLMLYAAGAKTVVDPFAGFSGRMLGALSLGMTYTGYDINGVTLNESKKLLEFIGEKATLHRANSLIHVDPAEYDVLISCPPYGNKEQWGDHKNTLPTAEAYVERVLRNFNAKVYIFVVDKVEKYQGHIVQEHVNSSHFGQNTEKVLVFYRD